MHHFSFYSKFMESSQACRKSVSLPVDRKEEKK